MPSLVFPLGGPLGYDGTPVPTAFPGVSRVPVGANADALGVDISCLPDLDPGFGLISGRAALAECVGRRFVTTAGTLLNCPRFGKDLRDYVNAGFDAAGLVRLRHDVEAEARKDQRVSKATAAVEYDSDTRALTVTVELVDGDGPFTLTMLVTALSVDFLRSTQ